MMVHTAAEVSTVTPQLDTFSASVDRVLVSRLGPFIALDSLWKLVGGSPVFI